MSKFELRVNIRPEIYYNQYCYPDHKDMFGNVCPYPFLFVRDNQIQKIDFLNSWRQAGDYKFQQKRIKHFLHKLRIKNNYDI